MLKRKEGVGNDLPIEQQPLFYTRYVDDVFVVVKNPTDLHSFFDFINTVEKNLQFTIEMPVDRKLPFLDTCVEHHGSSFKIRSYEKPSNTDLLIPAVSFCPQKYKSNTLFILYERAYKINQNFCDITKAWDKITTKLYLNGYEDHAIKDAINKVYNKYKPNNEQQSTDDEQQKIYLKLPYTNKINNCNNTINSLNQKLCDIKICPVYEVLKTKNLFQTKSVDSPSVRSNIVYKYSCDACNMVYIGATERHFQTRQNEHLSGKNNSEIGFHEHAPKRSNFSILGRYKYPFTAESLFICNENINNLMNTRLRSNKIELFVHGNTLTQLRNRSMTT